MRVSKVILRQLNFLFKKLENVSKCKSKCNQNDKDLQKPFL